MHRERLGQVVLDVEAHAIALSDLDSGPRYASVESPSVQDPARNQFGTHVFHSNVERLHAVLEPPGHIRDVRTDDRDDAGAKLVWRYQLRGWRRLPRHVGWLRRRVCVLRGSGVRGSGAGNRRQPAQKRASAGRHANL
jgi:hypothetical protein